MAQRNYFVDIDLNQNEMQFAVLHSLGTAPSSGSEVEGQVYYDTGSNTPFFWNGSTWTSMSSATASSVPWSGVTSGTNTNQTLNVGSSSIILIDAGTIAWTGSSSGNITLDTNFSGASDLTIFLPDIAGSSTLLASSDTPAANQFVIATGTTPGLVEYRTIANSDISGILGINDLSDVVISTAVTGDYIRYNGSNWVDVTAGQIVSDINASLDHGSLTGLTDDDHLIYLTALPTTTRANSIVPTTFDTTSLAIRAANESAGTATFNYFVVRNSANSKIFSIGQNVGIPQIEIANVTDFNIDTNVVIFSGHTLTLQGASGNVSLDVLSSGVTTWTLTLPPTSGSSGQYLQTDGSGNTTWETISIANSLNDLTDVVLTSPANPSYLRYNGSNWIDVAASQIVTDINGSLDHGTLSGLTDDDHSQYVFKTPTASARNLVVSATNDITAFSVQSGPNSGSATFNFFELLNTSGNVLMEAQDSNGSYLVRFSSDLTGVVSFAPFTVVDAPLTIFNAIADGVSIAASSSSFASWTFTLPENDGDANQFLQTDGNGVTSWATALTSVALDDLTDVVITSPANPSYLRYNGSNWIDVNAASVAADINGELDHGNLNASSLTDDDHTQYIIDAPGASTRNVITSSSNSLKALGIEYDVAATPTTYVPWFEILGNTGLSATLFSVGIGPSSYEVYITNATLSVGGAATFSSFVTMESRLDIENGAGLRLYDNDDSNYVAFDVPINVTTTYTLTFPDAAPPGANYVLMADASGNFAWVDGSGVAVSDHGSLSGLGDDDHTQYIIDDPSTRANLINPTSNDITSLTIQGANNAGSSTFNVFEITNSSAGLLFNIQDFNGSYFTIFNSNLTGVSFNTAVTVIDSLFSLFNGSSQGVSITVPASFTSWSLTLPANDGDAGQFLQTNGSGVTSWVDALSSASLDDLTDVVLTSPANPSYLRYNGSNWIDVAPSQIVTDVNALLDHGALSGLGDDDHAQYIINVPSSGRTNIITPSDNTTPLILRGPTGASVRFGITDNAGANELFIVSGTNDLQLAGDQILFNHPAGTAGGYVLFTRSSTGDAGYIDLSSSGAGAGGYIVANTNGAEAAGFLAMNSNGSSRGGNIDLAAAVGTSSERAGQWTGTAGASGRGGDLIMDGSAADAGDLDISGGSVGSPGGSILTYGGFASSGSPILRGGNIHTYGANATSGTRRGGDILTYGALGGKGGDIFTFATSSGQGGDINTSAGSTTGDGGSIDTSGGTASSGGSIDTSGGTAASGGNITTAGGLISTGGNIDTSGGGVTGTDGGNIDTSGGTSSSVVGGNIDTSGNTASGGSITTANGGGSINTATGVIGLGLTGARLTLDKSVTADRTATLIDESGSIPVFSVAPASVDLFALSDSTNGRIRFATRGINDLSDVDTSGLSTNDLLQYNGSNWVAIDPATVGVTDHGSLSGLTDDDHTQYLIGNPLASSRNLIDPSTADVKSLTIEAAPNSGSATFDIFEIQDSSQNTLINVQDTSGSFRANFGSNLAGVTFSTPVTFNQSSPILVNAAIQAVALAIPSSGVSNWTLTLPVNDGDANQFLQTNGSGVTSWADALTSVALDDLTDVVISTTVAGDYLRYNGSNWVDVTSAQIVTDINSSLDHGSLLGLTDDDHTQYIINVPTGARANTIAPAANDVTALTIEAGPNSGAADFEVFQILDSADDKLFDIRDSSGLYFATFYGDLTNVIFATQISISNSSLRFLNALSQSVTIDVPASITDWTLTLPANDGNSGQFLQTDGGGNTSWVDALTSVALNDLTDVVITAAVTGDYLRYNGSNWVDVTSAQIVSDINSSLDHGSMAGLSDDDHSQYLLTSPSGTTRNQVTGGNGQTILFQGTSGTGGTYTITEGDTIFAVITSGNDDWFRIRATSDSAFRIQARATALELHDETPIHFKSGTTAAANRVALKANSTISSNYTITLPGSAPGSAGDVLYNTGSGTLAWGGHGDLSGLTTGDPHSQYIVVSPSSSARNTITAGNAGTTPLTVKANASQAVTIFSVEPDTGSAHLRVDSNGNSFFGQDVTITGDLTVNGTTTTVNTTELVVEDNIIVVNSAGTVQDAGLEVERGASANASIYYNESVNEWYINNAAVALQIARKYVDNSTITGDGILTSFAITHNMGTSDVLVGIYDSSDNQVEVEVVITNSNTVTVNFNDPVPNLTTFRAVIVG